jgi:hypothetical protein
MRLLYSGFGFFVLRSESSETTVNNDLLTYILPLYSIKPSFLNLFMKKFTRERVVPTMLARVSCETFARRFRGWSASP